MTRLLEEAWLPHHEAYCESLGSPFSGALAVYSVGVVGVCFALAVLCDTYLDDILHSLMRKYHIPSEIAGVTFLAIGGSLPELSIHVLAVLRQTEVGVASIFGAGIYNLTLGLAITCFVSRTEAPGNAVHLPSLARDCLFYLVAVLLILLFNRDGAIDVREATILVSLYPYYILCVLFSQHPHMETKVYTHEPAQLTPPTPSIARRLRVCSAPFLALYETALYPVRNNTAASCVVCLGFVVLFAYWIMVLVQRIGCLLHVDLSMISMILVAIGTSMPDTILIATQARKGHAGMALSGLLGSNIFDVLIGLGIPWVLSANLYSTDIRISSPHIVQGFTFLLGSVLVAAVSVLITQQRVHWTTGIAPLLAYAVYILVETSF